jgi:hypothetical protein
MKKKFLLVLIAMLLLLFTGCTKKEKTEVSIFSKPVVQKVGNQRKDWLDVSSFICYYGDFDIEAQSKFDVAIIHSNVLYRTSDAKEKVKELQDKGTYVISYITVGEDDTLSTADSLGEGGFASYYIYENGYPKQNTNWGSYFVDAGNPVWQAKIIDESNTILSYGVDGLFLDTLDTVDILFESIPGMVDLVKKLDENFPDAKIVANRGFTVLPYISSYIDGVMFESFNTTYDFTLGKVADLSDESNDYNENVASNIINSVRQYDYFPVFALDYVNEYEYSYMPKGYYDRSWQYDFIPYTTYDINLGTAAVPLDTDGNLLTPASKRGELALSKKTSTDIGGPNADVTAKNFAYVGNGTTLKVGSTFAGYNVATLNDGWYATPENHNQANWSKEAWASNDNKNADHYIEFTFTNEQSVSEVVVHWANDSGTYYSPQLAKIEVWVNDAWVEVASLTNGPADDDGFFRAFEQSWTFTFTSINTTKVRVVQPKGMGCADKYGDKVREGIMWVSEVEIF